MLERHSSISRKPPVEHNLLMDIQRQIPFLQIQKQTSNLSPAFLKSMWTLQHQPCTPKTYMLCPDLQSISCISKIHVNAVTSILYSRNLHALPWLPIYLLHFENPSERCNINPLLPKTTHATPWPPSYLLHFENPSDRRKINPILPKPTRYALTFNLSPTFLKSMWTLQHQQQS